MANLYECGGGKPSVFIFPRIELNGGSIQSITSGTSTTEYYKTEFRLPSGVKKLKIEQLKFPSSVNGVIRKVCIETVVDEEQIGVYTVDTNNIKLDLSDYTNDVHIYSYSQTKEGYNVLSRSAFYMLNVSLEF